MAFDDLFPSRTGGAIGASLENRMLWNVGGAEGIRTKIMTLPDGSEARLKTRAGMPEFVRLAAPIEEPGGFDECVALSMSYATAGHVWAPWFPPSTTNYFKRNWFYTPKNLDEGQVFRLYPGKIGQWLFDTDTQRWEWLLWNADDHEAAFQVAQFAPPTEAGGPGQWKNHIADNYFMVTDLPVTTEFPHDSPVWYWTPPGKKRQAGPWSLLFFNAWADDPGTMILVQEEGGRQRWVWRSDFYGGSYDDGTQAPNGIKEIVFADGDWPLHGVDGAGWFLYPGLPAGEWFQCAEKPGLWAYKPLDMPWTNGRSPQDLKPWFIPAYHYYDPVHQRWLDGPVLAFIYPAEDGDD